MTDKNEKDYELLYSMLADGELASDETNSLLLEALQDKARAEQLSTQLKLRERFKVVRTSQPEAETMLTFYGEESADKKRFGGIWKFAAAAVVMIAFTLAGYFLGVTGEGYDRGMTAATDKTESQELQKTFRFYESAAGPIAWMVDSNNDVAVKEATDTTAAGSPIGLIVRIKGQGEQQKVYRIVVRDRIAATIPLAGLANGDQTAQLILNPHKTENSVKLGYTLVIDPGNSSDVAAVLGGEKTLDNHDDVLGQLPIDGKDISITVKKVQI